MIELFLSNEIFAFLCRGILISKAAWEQEAEGVKGGENEHVENCMFNIRESSYPINIPKISETFIMNELLKGKQIKFKN